MARRRRVRARRRADGLDAFAPPAKELLAQRIARAVALSLQRSRQDDASAPAASVADRRGLLASRLRLATQNAADMTAFLRRREAEAACSRREREGEGERESSAQRRERSVCVICLDGDVSAASADAGACERVTALPCGHVFHTRCIGRWLQQRRVCPVDRQPVDRQPAA